ncbi:U4/U6 small nuclear ribonucleoprotein PRP3, putative [Plasmodium knowlesi strain H]|uniref:U4/U6 small nuclear ribonucleoprotein PRP3, putative n=3 Tax=Plasmodium knowlesi TaxID=5850 RepID=A0A5K1U5B1_PLAKH|nr:uncharacterized protein PKNH_1409700 [Plasmodium knowlesi strain H]OTN63607.1 putative U4/U6 small nuclear ribonucleoprotein PRP3 [Plasmodium knowlesi]CAA9990696.1 U4/U6 small nuclear ribonucleoprotein PRP3, putative [Plasmodium knowlesi strain H]SBO25907.1 U4/U6 small nuclear ribonucleoprotein PRP3, putative [Plasmodium knowlesi strain H]SBO28662.1 U4/U6 small nuclear ribonucleoprotein PRP3, putative [Plasmodium knowlesi strain H]VVS80170.1 U4/U6 small nuclear ribonucleoprotein PRP3, putat|eukprot:XP_002261986.1 [Plasmodium knowlesi strain H]
MEEVQKKRKSRWGDLENSTDNINKTGGTVQVNKSIEPIKTNDVNALLNRTGNILGEFNMSGASRLATSTPGIMNPPVGLNTAATGLPTQFPLTGKSFPALSPAIHLNILKATEAAKLAIERAKRASRFKEDMKENVKKVEFVPKPLKFDEQGREIDDEGNVINIKPITFSTLKVNINKLEENNLLKKKNELGNKNSEEYVHEDNKWFDSRIKNVQKKKKKNAFNFITPGSFMKLANSRNYNTKSQMNFDLKKFMQDKKNVQSLQEMSLNFLNSDLNDSINPNLIDINNKDVRRRKEWKDNEKYDAMEKWDLVLFKKVENKENLKEYILEQMTNWKKGNLHLGGGTTHHGVQKPDGNSHVDADEISKNDKNDPDEYMSSVCLQVNKLIQKRSANILLLQCNEIIINEDLYKINLKKITNYVEHPISLNEDKKEEKMTTPHMFLTPLERKKLRKRKRQEKEREKQDKIRIGLMPPPPPKMKLSNLMRVLGDSAVSQPSRIELEVRQQMKERELRHFKQNQERKLNPEEKSKKKMKKWTCDPNQENEVLVIYISNLSNKKHIFKIDINAQQLHLTGVCVMTVLYNFIIVEGKHISIERYKRLIFRRIKWNEDEYNDEEEDDDGDDDEDDEDEGDEEGGSGGIDHHHNSNNMNDKADTSKIKSNLDTQTDYHPNDPVNINVKQGCTCSLIWSGTVKKKNFLNWKMIIAKTEMEVTDYLQKHDALHYFHIVKKHRNVSDDV